MLRLTYGPAATFLRVNRGWRTANAPGFLVDMESGELLTGAATKRVRPAAPIPRQRVTAHSTTEVRSARANKRSASDPPHGIWRSGKILDTIRDI